MPSAPSNCSQHIIKFQRQGSQPFVLYWNNCCPRTASCVWCLYNAPLLTTVQFVIHLCKSGRGDVLVFLGYDCYFARVLVCIARVLAAAVWWRLPPPTVGEDSWRVWDGSYGWYLVSCKWFCIKSRPLNLGTDLYLKPGSGSFICFASCWNRIYFSVHTVPESCDCGAVIFQKFLFPIKAQRSCSRVYRDCNRHS